MWKLSKNMDFIQIKKVTRNKKKEQVSVPETISTKDILSFRPWHKGYNDTIKGDMTMVIMRGKPPVQTHAPDAEDLEDGFKKIDNDSYIIYVEENYQEFTKRMSGNVIMIPIEK